MMIKSGSSLRILGALNGVIKVMGYISYSYVEKFLTDAWVFTILNSGETKLN